MGTDLCPGIINTAINTSSFTEINIPSNTGRFSKIIVRTRDGSSFYISDTSGGTNYYSMGVSVEIDVKDPVGSPLFYAKGTASTTLEVLLRR